MNKKLDVYLAGPRGFCAGVDRAILMVKEAIKKYGGIKGGIKSIYTSKFQHNHLNA